MEDGEYNQTQFDIYEKSMQIYTPVAGSIGLFLNLLTILVFLRKRMKKYTISITMISLAASDTTIIAHTLFIYWYDQKYQDFRYVNSTIWCHLHGYFDLVFCGSSAWLIILVSLERWFSVLKPWVKNYYFQARNVMVYILAIFLASCLTHSYVPFVLTLEIDGNSTCCTTKSKELYNGLGTLSVIVVYLVPFITLAILNAQIVRRLYERQLNAAVIQAVGHRKSVSKQTVIQTVSNTARYQLANKHDQNLSITLVIVALTYALLTMPYQIYWFYDNLILYYYDEIEFIEWKQSIARSLARDITFQIRNLNYIINFFLYSVLSTLFRRELISLVAADKQIVLKFFGCKRSVNGNLVEMKRAKSTRSGAQH